MSAAAAVQTDFHVYCVRGEGFSMFWHEGREDDLIRFDWKHGWVFAPGNRQQMAPSLSTRARSIFATTFRQ
jgi:hypothetical protein